MKGKTLSLLAALMLTTMMTYISCRKIDKFEVQKPQVSSVEKFLNLPTSTSPEVKRIAERLRELNKRRGFLNEIAKQDGFPVWHKVILNKPATNQRQTSARTNNTNDTIVYIPLVPENSNHVAAFIYARLNDSINLQLHRGNNYAAYGFGNVQDSTDNAERLALQIMVLDNIVFGHKRFKLLDNRLFSSVGSWSGSTERFLEIQEPQTNGSRNSSHRSSGHWETGTITHCSWMTNRHCTQSGQCASGTCDNCSLCVTTAWGCVTTVRYYFVSDDESWNYTYNNPSGQGGGGSYNGSTPTGPIACNPQPLLDNGLIPCPAGNTTGFIPAPAALLDEVDDSQVDDTCLQKVIDIVTRPKLTNYISKTYNAQGYTSSTTHRYAVKYEIDTALVGQNGQPTPGHSNTVTLPNGTHEVTITLNTKLFQNSTNEWVATVILHELMHGILKVNSPQDSTNELAHKAMFNRGIPIYIWQSLKEIFPLIDENDAIALGMDGLGLPDIFMIPDLFGSGTLVLDNNKNRYSINNYFQSIAQALDAVLPYRNRTGNKGTPYCQ
jgi:hypothetical protein